MATQADSGNDGNASSQENVSGQKPNQESSQPEYITVAEFNKLQGQFETLRRSQQSDKDKGIKQTNQRIDALEGDFRTVLQQALQKGQNISDVISELDASEEAALRREQRELFQALKEGRLPLAQSGGSGESGGVNVAQALQELNLDANDTRVQAFRARTFASEAELYREAAKLQAQILTRQPSDADKTSKESERQEKPEAQEALKQEYNERSKGLFGMQLISLQREMRRKGMNI